jgi:hypothetical protein
MLPILELLTLAVVVVAEAMAELVVMVVLVYLLLEFQMPTQVLFLQQEVLLLR